LAAFLGFPIFAYFLNEDFPLILFSLSILGLIVYSHTENIGRLMKGTEPKISLISI
jgi:glycerol-3-phosphate acyltransferase PlsY